MEIRNAHEEWKVETRVAVSISPAQEKTPQQQQLKIIIKHCYLIRSHLSSTSFKLLLLALLDSFSIPVKSAISGIYGCAYVRKGVT